MSGLPRYTDSVPDFIRFVRLGWEEHAPWKVAPFVPDAEIARIHVPPYGLIGLGGCGRDLRSLSQDERRELVRMVNAGSRNLSQAEKKLLSEFLWRSGYNHYVPPLDIDVCEESDDFKRTPIEEVRARAHRYALALDGVAEEVGLGRPLWHTTNNRGGLHGDLLVPQELSSPNLLRGLKLLAQQAARLASERLGEEIPLLSRIMYRKGVEKDEEIKGRPATYLDDTLFNRYGTARGVVWRVAGGKKPKPGSLPKQAIDLTSFAPIRFACEPDPVSIDLLRPQIASVDDEDQAIQRKSGRKPGAFLPSIPRADLVEEDRAFVRTNRFLQHLWDGHTLFPGDRSMKLWELFVVAALLGADDERLSRLGWAMPGANKQLEDRRDERYIRDTIDSARNAIYNHRGRVRQYEKLIKEASRGQHGRVVPVSLPLGLALDAAGWLRDPDHPGESYPCRCPAGHERAVYFATTDVWWCKGCPRRQGIEVLLAIPDAKERDRAVQVYGRELRRGKSYCALECGRTAPRVQIRAWVEAYREKAPLDKILRALVGTLLRMGVSDEWTAGITHMEAGPEWPALEEEPLALDRARRIRLMLREPKPGRMPPASANWIREHLGARAAHELALAIVQDSGLPWYVVAKAVMGLGLVRGDDEAWLWLVHNKMPEGDPARANVARPSACRRYKQNVVGDGKKVGERCLVCEGVGCDACWIPRVLTELAIVSDEESDESWVGKGPYYVHLATGLSTDDVDRLRLQLKRYVRLPKWTSIGAQEGKLSLLVVTTNGQADSALGGTVSGFTSRCPGSTYRRLRMEGLKEVLDQVIHGRLGLNAHEKEIRKGRDEAAFLAWLRWRRGKHLVTRSPAALAWPSREALRKAASAARGEEPLDLSEFDSVSYELVHVATDLVIHSQEHPYTLYDALKIGKASMKLQRAEKELLGDDPEALEQGDLLEQALRQELAREAGYVTPARGRPGGRSREQLVPA